MGQQRDPQGTRDGRGPLHGLGAEKRELHPGSLGEQGFPVCISRGPRLGLANTVLSRPLKKKIDASFDGLRHEACRFSRGIGSGNDESLSSLQFVGQQHRSSSFRRYGDRTSQDVCTSATAPCPMTQ